MLSLELAPANVSKAASARRVDGTVDLLVRALVYLQVRATTAAAGAKAPLENEAATGADVVEEDRCSTATSLCFPQ